MTNKKRVGLVLDGRWKLERVIGEGAMGRVYLARQLSIQRHVAVKIIHPNHITSPTAIPRFLREARILSALQHPNIVRLLDFGRDDRTGDLYLSMDFLHGQTLSQFLEVRRLSLKEVLLLAEQTLLALHEVHKLGVVHRDIKPGNLFVDFRQGMGIHVTLFDFGIALLDTPGPRLSARNIIKGTPGYTAPEQIECEPVTPRTDLYSLGIVLYELLSGALPFAADTPMNIFMQQLGAQAPPLEKRWDLPEEPMRPLIQLVNRMVDRYPAGRPENAFEALEDIRECLSLAGISRSAPLRKSTATGLPHPLGGSRPPSRPRMRAVIDERPTKEIRTRPKPSDTIDTSSARVRPEPSDTIATPSRTGGGRPEPSDTLDMSLVFPTESGISTRPRPDHGPTEETPAEALLRILEKNRS